MESDGSVAAKYPSANDIVMAIQFKACALNFSLSIFISDYKKNYCWVHSSGIIQVCCCRAKDQDKMHRIRLQNHRATDRRRQAVTGDPKWRSAQPWHVQKPRHALSHYTSNNRATKPAHSTSESRCATKRANRVPSTRVLGILQRKPGYI